MQLDNLYQEVILDHYKRPEYKNLQTEFQVAVHHVNPSCGEEISVRLSLNLESEIQLTWDGIGCSISMASASVMAGLLNGKTPEQAEPVLDAFIALMQSKGKEGGDEELLEDGIAFSGVSKYPARIKCALLAWMAYKDASLQIMGINKSEGDV